MKLKFSIHYHTTWGQSLHVCLTTTDAAGRVREQNLLMQTADGERWTLETAIMESRQSPLAALSYFYQVEDSEGQLVVREWNLIPRLYAAEGSQDYLFPDTWRDIPLSYHLYSDAYLVTTGRPRYEAVQPFRLPLFRKTVVFRVSAPQLGEGESLGLLGNHPALGNWNPAQYLAMTPVGAGEWVLSLNAYGLFFPMEYKYVVVDSATRQLKTWEGGDNRTTSEVSLADGQVWVKYDDALHLADDVWKVAGVIVPKLSKKLIDWCAATGMRMIKVQPVKAGRLQRKSLLQWKEWCDYAREKRVALMAPIRIDLNETLGNTRRWRHRLAFIARYCDAVSVDFHTPQGDESHDDYWEYIAGQRLRTMMNETRLLIAADNIDMSMGFMAGVMRRLHILSLEVETVSKVAGHEFARTEDNPYLSVDTLTTRGMPLLDTWWRENPGRTQRYFVTVLHREGKAPRHLTIRVAEEIIARHLHSPSLLCLLRHDDLSLVTDERLRMMLERGGRIV